MSFLACEGEGSDSLTCSEHWSKERSEGDKKSQPANRKMYSKATARVVLSNVPVLPDRRVELAYLSNSTLLGTKHVYGGR